MSAKPAKYKFTVHVADEPKLNGTQTCRRCELAVLSEDILGKWREGAFVVEQKVWRSGWKEVGYVRMGLFVVTEDEIIANDHYQFCLSMIESKREIEAVLAVGVGR